MPYPQEPQLPETTRNRDISQLLDTVLDQLDRQNEYQLLPEARKKVNVGSNHARRVSKNRLFHQAVEADPGRRLKPILDQFRRHLGIEQSETVDSRGPQPLSSRKQSNMQSFDLAEVAVEPKEFSVA